jgi:hypothetical protein
MAVVRVAGYLMLTAEVMYSEVSLRTNTSRDLGGGGPDTFKSNQLDRLESSVTKFHYQNIC